MTPWWQRPTAEGAQDDEGDDRPGRAPEPAEPEAPRETTPSDTRTGSAAPAPAETFEARAAEPAARATEATTAAEAPAEAAYEDDEEEGDEAAADRSGDRGRSRSRRRRRRPKNGGDEETAEARPSQRRRERQPDDEEEDLTFDFSPEEIERISREIVVTAPERSSSVSDERKIALFCDLENIAIGVRDSEIKKFDINLVLERLLEKGKIIVKKAYCDWERYSDYKRPFHEAAIEMIDIPQRYYSGKNSADIKMVVDAMDLSYSKEHLDTFALLSGDSDFSPLVSKLKENNKYVIGIGVKGASSALLIDNCDEFIYYEDVWRDRQKAPKIAGGINKKNAEAFSLMIDAIQALVRENKDVLWGSMIKQTMQRKKPSFNEGYYGYGSFSELLEDAERSNIIKLKKDRRSGTYIVTGFASRKSA